MQNYSSVDLRLLFELSKTPRAKLTEIAKRAKMSRDQVQARIHKFQASGLILRFHPLIPFDRFGMSHHIMRIKLRGTSPAKEKRIIDFLVSNTLVTWVACLDGRFNIGYSLRCLNPKEAADFNDTLLEKFHDLILDRTTGLYVSIEFFSRDYLLNKKHRTPPVIKEVKKFKALNIVDFKILESLAINARESSATIARDLIASKIVPSFSREAVAYRIQHLERSGWLGGYWMVLNPRQRKILYCKIEIRLEEISKEKLASFVTFCRSYSRVISMLRLLGSWDYEIDIELDDYRQGKAFIMELTKTVPNSIKDYEITMVNSIEKWEHASTIAMLASSVMKGV